MVKIYPTCGKLLVHVSNYSRDICFSMHMDSAPLSASLLADWMDVTSTMDPKALDDIQRELELNDFPFSY